MQPDDVTMVAAQSVEGYLKNALRRVRVPQEEGGRGTRRRLEMVTSAKPVIQQQNASTAEDEVKALPVPPAVLVDDEGEEWDVVDVQPLLKKAEADVKPSVQGDATAAHNAASATVHTDPAPSLHKKEGDDGQGHATRRPAEPIAIVHAKEEAAAADAAGGSCAKPMKPHAAGAGDAEGGEDYALQWSRPTLTSLGTTNQQSLRHQSSIRSEMVEEREIAKAKAKSEKILRVATKVTELLVVLQRGVRIMRETHHPQLWKRLLSMRNRKAHSSSSTADNEALQRRQPRVLFDAVRTAKRVVADAADGVALAMPSLAPCWVTQTKDTVQNPTSKATTVLLHAIRDAFDVAAAAVPRGTGDDEGGVVPDQGHHPLERLEHGALWNALKGSTSAAHGAKVLVPSPVHLCAVFLALSHLCKMQCRLVMAWAPFPQTNQPEDKPREPLMTTIAPRQKSAPTAVAKKKGASVRATSSPASSTAAPSAAGPAIVPPVAPAATPSYCWAEVWCPIRKSWISVNPCPTHTAQWNVPYALAFGNDGTVVDVTARYTSKFSSVLGRRLEAEHLSLHYIWRGVPKDAIGSSFLDVLLRASSQPRTPASCATWARERVQLERLIYAEPLPNTLAALKRHPLYVVEDDVGRWEGIYPKDKQTIVGSVKGLVVYKRSAVVSLRSRDGWLRAGRSLCSAHEAPYKVVKPPPSRPFSNPSHFFGRWQTVPFAPLPLRDDGTIEKHGNSSWYILLRGSQAPDGVEHLCFPNIARLARRMHVDFAHAVVAFEKRTMVNGRRGTWDAKLEGIVVPAERADAVRHAYAEWVALTAQEAAAKQRQRALKWWSHLIQQRLAMHRLESLYEEGEQRRLKQLLDGRKRPRPT